MIHQQEGGEEMCFIMWPIHYTRIQRSLLLIYIFVHALLSSVRGPGVSVFLPQAVRNSVLETPFRGHDFLIPLCLYSHGECGRGVWLRTSQSWLPVTTRDELFLLPPNHCTLTVGFHLESDSFVHTFAHIKRHTTWCISIHNLSYKSGRWLDVWCILVAIYHLTSYSAHQSFLWNSVKGVMFIFMIVILLLI